MPETVNIILHNDWKGLNNIYFAQLSLSFISITSTFLEIKIMFFNYNV